MGRSQQEEEIPVPVQHSSTECTKQGGRVSSLSLPLHSLLPYLTLTFPPPALCAAADAAVGIFGFTATALAFFAGEAVDMSRREEKRRM